MTFFYYSQLSKIRYSETCKCLKSIHNLQCKQRKFQVRFSEKNQDGDVSIGEFEAG